MKKSASIYRFFVLWGLLVLSILLLSSCKEDAGTPHIYHEKSEGAKVSQPIASQAGLVWNKPKYWVKKPASSSILLAEFQAFSTKSKTKGSARVTVVSLPGDGGGVYPNINRWRAQLGLAPKTNQGNDKDTQTLKGKFSNIKLVDLSNAKAQSILTGIITEPQATIFVKIKGNKKIVSENKEVLKQFLMSIHPSSNH